LDARRGVARWAKEEEMDLLVTLVIGGVIGWVASLIMGADSRMGIPANIVVGIIGSLLGFYLAGTLGVAAVGAGRWVVAILGAALLIGIIRALGLFRPRTV
jgi:uncharacterized membrane protein YeaQ/YmgE (transglycosylase-associated protein family)